MADTIRTEFGVMRWARRLGAALPFARSFIVRGAARACGVQTFVAEVEPSMRVEVDFRERMSRHLYLFGSIEPIIKSVFEAVLNPGDTVLDIGANFGYFTLLAGRRVGPGGKIIAFEPDPRNIARLKRNIALNALPQVEVIEAGLFDQTGTQALHLAGSAEDNMGTSSLLSDFLGTKTRDTIQVPIITVDAFVNQRGIEKIDLLKMDIEGAEWAAIRGATETLNRGIIRQVLLELHTGILEEPKRREILQIFSAAGFKTFLINEEKTPGLPWKEYLQDPAAKINLLNPHYLFVRLDSLNA